MKNRRFLKRAFSQVELLVTIGVLGCILALGIGMFNASNVNNNVDMTKQARLESTLKTATMSIVGKENKISRSTVCNASSLRAMLKEKIAGASDDDIRVNGSEALALRIKNLGTIAIQTSNNCNAANTVIPIALYTSPSETITELTVPKDTLPGGEANVEESSPETSDDTSYTPDVIAYEVSPVTLEPEETYSSPTVLLAAAPKSIGTPTKSSTNTPSNLPNNTTGDSCYEGVYDGATSCPNLNVEFYQMWEDGDCSRAPTYCEGNGQLEDGTYILTGKINLRCREGNGNFGVCACPAGKTYWVPGEYYTLQGKDGSKIIGLCVEQCSDFDPHMVPVSAFSKDCKCDTANNYNWDPVLKKCVKPGECSEAYLQWDEVKNTCVCNESYVRASLAADEVYTGIAANQCKKKCDSRYETPNSSKTDCDQIPCECLKERNMSDYQCQCKQASNLGNNGLLACGVQDNQYFTGLDTCVADCPDSYKVRNTNNITQCICPATKPAGITLGSYEIYDPNITDTCRKCNPNYPNREYDNVGPGNCVCKDLNDPTLAIGSNQYYDATAANCVSTCPSGQVPNPTRTGCQPDCGCLQKLVNNVCVCNTEITTEQIMACADFNNNGKNIFDPNSPTCQTNCKGTSHANTDLKECACDGCAEKYTGTTCVCDEATATTKLCIGSGEKYDPNSSICKSCQSINREYNASGQCVCKQASEIIFSDINMIYDINQPNCEAPCSGILIRNTYNPQECVCPSAKPVSFGVTAGYHYNNLAKSSGCVSPCPVGDYCPGSNPSDPSTPAIDPKDPNPTIDTTYPEGDVYKCPCGTYGNTTGLSTATCTNLCPAGKKCSAPGTVTPVDCSNSELCLPGQIGQCNPSSCTLPMVPNADHTGCVCSSTKPAAYSLPSGYKYDSSQATCIRPCPAGDYCPGSKPGYPNQPNIPTIGTDPIDPSPVMDNDDPFAYKCPCGRYSTGSSESKTSACMGTCYKGYYCTKGSTSPTQNECTASQKCPEGLNTCIPESCTLPLVPNSDQTACVCAATKPAAYSLQAGYKYDANVSGCIKPCPAGDYCPGSKPGYPNQPNIPTIGTDPIDPSPVMDNDDPFAYKCPCGKYSTGSTDSKTSSCMGDCTKGYYCTKGSTTPTQNKCTALQKCPTGLNTCAPDSCTSPYVPNSDQTTCVCGLSTTPPAGKYFKADTCEYIDCPAGHYCPGPNPTPYPNPEPDPNYPTGVIYCPCGMYQDIIGSSTCKSDCALGYYCPKGSTTNKGFVNGLEHKCTSAQKCPVGTCTPESCTIPMVPNADQTACVCASTRPSGYAITAGYKYSPDYPASGCMMPCPKGDYCPGSQPGNPDKPVVDPSDPTPIVDGGDPFVLKCPCGTYGSVTGLSAAACSGKCQAGYNCPAGSTKANQSACPSNKICLEGVCQPQDCAVPTVPNSAHTACVCASTKPSTYVIPASYHYDASAGVANQCLSLCPVGNYCPGTQPSNPDKPVVDSSDPTPTVNPTYPTGDVLKCPCGNYGATTGLANAACSGKCQAGYNCPAGSTKATQNKCSGQQLCKAGVCQITECVSPMIPDSGHTKCICGLSATSVPAGKYFDATKCSYENCPMGHYCPGSNPDPNPNPQPDPNYPTGVIYCPCGTFGAATGLSTYTCSGQCPIGYYCPQGSTNAKAHQCKAGQSCHVGTCEPDTCAFPTTSKAPYETCNECMTEANIKKQQADYFKKNEIWVNDVTKACKKCKSNTVPVSTGGCDCPPDKPYWYGELCNTCQNWGKLYFARNYTETAAACKLEKFLKGDVSCFDGSDGRVVPQDMKNMANKLSSTDKNRTFDRVFAYVIAENSSSAQVVGVFTISSWYAAFPTDWDSDYNTATAAANRVKGTCSQMCANINPSLKTLCVSTCEQFKNNTNSMFDHCAYAVNNKKNPQFIGQSFGTRSDELCTGGEIHLNNGCFYDLGNVLRKRYSPLVLDLKGDGFAYTSVEDGVIFDLNKDGVAERTAWTAPQTEFDNAFLILDKNKNGQVDNGGELFGDQNGEENGFKELAKYDANGDKVINKKDAIYQELRLWADMNKNAKVDYDNDGTSKEIKTLEEAGVTEISVDFQKLVDKKGNVLEDMYGNLVGFMGKFKMMVQNAAGKLVETVRKMMDVFFVTQ